MFRVFSENTTNLKSDLFGGSALNFGQLSRGSETSALHFGTVLKVLDFDRKSGVRRTPRNPENLNFSASRAGFLRLRAEACAYSRRGEFFGAEGLFREGRGPRNLSEIHFPAPKILFGGAQPLLPPPRLLGGCLRSGPSGLRPRKAFLAVACHEMSAGAKSRTFRYAVSYLVTHVSLRR